MIYARYPPVLLGPQFHLGDCSVTSQFTSVTNGQLELKET